MTTIRTNNVPRPIIYGFDLTPNERAEFDFLDWGEPGFAAEGDQFFRYKGRVYYLGNFMRIKNPGTTPPSDDPFWNWDGYAGDSYFSGLVVKIPNDEQVIVGTYFS